MAVTLRPYNRVQLCQGSASSLARTRSSGVLPESGHIIEKLRRPLHVGQMHYWGGGAESLKLALQVVPLPLIVLLRQITPAVLLLRPLQCPVQSLDGGGVALWLRVLLERPRDRLLEAGVQMHVPQDFVRE